MHQLLARDRRIKLKTGNILLLVITLGALLVFVVMLFPPRPHEKTTQMNNPALDDRCIFPELEMYPSEDFRKFFGPFPKPKCGKEENWVSIENGTFKFSEAAKAKYRDMKCHYSPVIRGDDDFTFYNGTKVEIEDGSKVKDAVMRVNCSSGEAAYENIHVGVPFNEKIVREAAGTHPNVVDLNILVFGFDSVSRLTWQRLLPKTYAYLTEVLGAVVMEGYNIVGDGTPATLFPMLTGQTEETLPEARRGHPGAKPIDDYPWIWKEYKNEGYVTHWLEDGADVGGFTYRFLGFKDPPTDHYVRHFYLALEQAEYGVDRFCLGSEYKYNVFFNYLTQFLDVYKNTKKFTFALTCELSHSRDNRPLAFADDDMKVWLRQLKDKGHFNKTLFIVMSDHGARFNNLRETEQGKQEERNPFFSVILPDWFKKKYSNAYANLLLNSKRLTTPFDIYATFRHLLGKRGNFFMEERAYSLFSRIPEMRTCEHADVPVHWCNCLQWYPVSIDSKDVLSAARAFVDLVNSLTENVREKCHILGIDKILSAVVYTSKSDLLKFKKAADKDGRLPDLTANTKIASKMYQLTIHTKPCGGHFEVTVKHNLEKDVFLARTEDVSRMNKYGDDPSCVMAKLPHLRRFCCCKAWTNIIF